MPIKKQCISKGCGGLRHTCERAINRHSEAVEVVSLWEDPNNNTKGGGCMYYLVREELGGGDRLTLPKFGAKHNQHAPGYKGTPILGSNGKPLVAPSPMVKRHIKDGRDQNS